MSHSTTERFDADAEEQEYFADGENVSRAVFFDALLGIHPYVDLWIQVPWFDLSYTDAAGARTAEGFGDARGFVRWSFGHQLLGGIPLSLRVGAKAPLEDFPLDAEIIPVGEGQWDVEAWIEGGQSFHPLPIYAVAWLGYRWRFENEEALRDPGDERLLLVDVGLTTRPLGAKLVLEGLFGKSPVIQEIRVGQGRREILYVQPELLFQPTRSLTVEMGLRQHVHGRSYPAGRQFLVGLFYRPG
jgi:hypothetical protein